MRGCGFIVVLLVLFASSNAAASTELNGLFDARSMGMGGTGVAFLDSGGAIPTNPALLQQIGTLTLTFNGLLFMSQPEAPYQVTHRNAMGETFNNYETVRSSTIFAPLFYLGGAYRIFDRLVVGVGFGPMIGQGTSVKYRPAPELRPELEIENDAAAGLLELSTAVAVRLTDTLSLGAAWRITYITQSIKTPLPGRGFGALQLDRDMNPVFADISNSGVDFAGLQVGLLWTPDPALRFGLSYRSKVTVDGEGTTKTTNPLDGSPLSLPTTQPFPIPHTFRAGIAVTALQDKFTFAADVKYLMYADAWPYLETTTIRNGMRSTSKTPTHWKDAYNVHLGGEYMVTDAFAARGGYIISTTATPEAYAKAFMAPPGVAHCWTLGIGWKALDSLSLDLAGSYIVLRTKVGAATPDNAGVGIYSAHTGEFSLSATYRN